MWSFSSHPSHHFSYLPVCPLPAAPDPTQFLPHRTACGSPEARTCTSRQGCSRADSYLLVGTYEAHLFQIPCVAASYWQLKIYHGGSIYVKLIGKIHKFEPSCLPPERRLLSIYHMSLLLGFLPNLA